MQSQMEPVASASGVTKEKEIDDHGTLAKAVKGREETQVADNQRFLTISKE